MGPRYLSEFSMNFPTFYRLFGANFDDVRIIKKDDIDDNDNSSPRKRVHSYKKL